jgi:hypothetical protein
MQTPLLPIGISTGQGLATQPDLPPLLCNEPGSFAWRVLHERHPALISQIRDNHPYQPAQHDALDRLREETTNGLIRPLEPEAPDRPAWDAWGANFYGRPWPDTPFLWAESYFYRRLLDAISYFTPGPWYWIDPFEHLKTNELRDPTVEPQLVALDHLADLSPDKQSEALLLASLWGNRADLGFKIGIAAAASGEHEHAAGLVADDTTTVLAALIEARKICVIADNAGRELLSDLILIDHILANDATRVSIHVKPSPYYVSDAVTADLIACLRRLADTPGTASAIAHRLRQAMSNGRLSVYTHWFYCAPLSFHHMPKDLARELAAASLVLVKGDLNYRRLVGDCPWPATTPFADTVGYFPAPVSVLRTLKSDVIVGMDAATVKDLDHTGEPWRTNGARGLVQAKL